MNSIAKLFKSESASGILLVIAAALAMIIANSPWGVHYTNILATEVIVGVKESNIELLQSFAIYKPVLLWVNDGLMAVFFFMVGLEIKRELIKGQLSDRRQVVLPIAAAIGGIAVPALIYAAINSTNPDQTAMDGWAIPAATDIAFALGVLSLLGKRVPAALKLFLLTLAIIDDLGAIIIIALFYTQELSLMSMAIAAFAVAGLFALNRMRVYTVTAYFILGLIMWVAVLKSGVHATLAGVVIAFFIPLHKPAGESVSMAEKLEHDLHKGVAFIILPVFAFANSGISFSGTQISDVFGPISMGIALGLLLGKPIGVMFASWLVIKLGIAKLPEGVNWSYLFGVSLLAGIGFTMSLFISSLAFIDGSGMNADRIGIFLGSTLSAILGYMYLNKVLPKA